MPHAVLGKTIDLFDFAKKFKAIMKKDQILIKIDNIYVDKNNQTALLPTFVMEEEKQNFFIEIISNEEKTTVRLFPLTDPKKTPGVKTSLGLVASELMRNYGGVITKTNIENFIPS